MPKCPHCKESITVKSVQRHQDSDESEEVNREVYGTFTKEVMYSCPHCDCVLGFSFFIGGALTGRP